MIAHAITAPPDLADQVASIRSVFASGRTRVTDWRLRQLRGIERLLDEHEDQIAAALAQDLGRERAEAWLGDIASTRGEAEFARKHLRRCLRANSASPLVDAMSPSQASARSRPRSWARAAAI